jgi:hypothetical protein
VKGSKIRFNFTKAGFYAVPAIERVRVFRAKGDFSLEKLYFPEGLVLMGYTYFGAGDGWVDKDDSWWAVGENVSLGRSQTCSRLWIVGTKDPSFGTLRVRIDGEIWNVSCKGDSHERRQILFSSGKLSMSSHGLNMMQVGKDPIAIHAVYYLRDGQGMFEFEKTEYVVNEKTKLVKILVKRIDGSGNCSVRFDAWPDSAVPGKHYKDVSTRLEFVGDEENKTVTIPILDTKGQDLMFYCRLSLPIGGILGFNYSANVVFRTPSKLSKAAIGAIAGASALILVVAVVVSVIVMRKRDSVQGLETISNEKMIQ